MTVDLIDGFFIFRVLVTENTLKIKSIINEMFFIVVILEWHANTIFMAFNFSLFRWGGGGGAYVFPLYPHGNKRTFNY